MQFIGQTHLLRVPLTHGTPTREELQQLFEDVYFKRFRVELSEIRANLVNLNCSVIGRRSGVDLSSLIDAAGRKELLKDALIETRSVWFESGWCETPVYWRDHMPAGMTFEGPAIIEQMDTTSS